MTGRQVQRLFVSLITLVLTLAPAVHSQDAGSSDITIGFVIDGEWFLNDSVRTLFETEIRDLLGTEFDARFPESKRRTGSWDSSSIRSAVASQLADPDVDLVITLGVIASQVAALIESPPKPIVAPFVIDPVMQSVPYADGRSGRSNLVYVASPWRLPEEIKRLAEIVPFSHLCLIGNEAFLQAIPGLETRMRAELAEQSVQLSVVPVAANYREALSQIPDDVDAVYLAPLLQLSDDDFANLIDSLIAQQLPSFSVLADIDVPRGVLAGYAAKGYLQLIARRTAIVIQRILLGDDAAQIPVAIAFDEELLINMETARSLGVFPSWAILTDAELINQQRTEISRVVSYTDVLREALSTNLDLKVARANRDARSRSVDEVRSSLWPQLSVSAQSVWIDEDRATAFGSTQAEQTTLGSVNLNQVIFAEPIYASLDIARLQRAIAVADERTVELDLIAEAASAYLGLLRARTVERIARGNVARTRANLDLARVREALGTARAAEVLRWESELATDRREAIEANAVRNVAEIALNRILNRPVEQSFLPIEFDLSDPELLIGNERFLPYLDNPDRFRRLRAFLDNEARQRAPELVALTSAIQVQERQRSSVGRSFWLPQVGLNVEFSRVIDRSGANSAGGSGGLEGLLPPGTEISTPDDNNWQIGLQATLPLFNGGERLASRARLRHEATRLELTHQATSERVAERVRSAMHLAGASYAGIRQSQLAAQAADDSYALVADAYSRGAATIVDLIDAQNAARIADEAAANAVYDFLLDMVSVQRALGWFYRLESPESQDRLLDRLDAFADTEGSD